MRALPTGKLDFDLLRRMLEMFSGPPDPRVVVGPKIGEDATVIEMADRYLVAKTDPITFATEEIGWYLVCVNANDIATMGARPKWLLCTLLLPEGRTDEALVEGIFSQIRSACDRFGISLVGGHTEVTYGLDRPIVVGHMLGEVDKGRLITSSGARPGHKLLLVKWAAIEGTSIIARELADKLREAGVDEKTIERAKGFLYDPGISVVEEALLCCEAGRPSAMHDPTEGGVATGIHELAEASEVGVRVKAQRIPLLPETERFCSLLGIDPLGLIASGSLLVAAPPHEARKIRQVFDEKGIPCSEIGEFTPNPKERTLLLRDGREVPLPLYPQDELTKIL